MEQGDCRAVVGTRDGRVVRLTHDHRPDVAVERQRVEAAGGTIVDGRVDGVLSVTRAFGDFDLKRGSTDQYQPGKLDSEETKQWPANGGASSATQDGATGGGSSAGASTVTGSAGAASAGGSEQEDAAAMDDRAVDRRNKRLMSHAPSPLVSVKNDTLGAVSAAPLEKVRGGWCQSPGCH